MSSLKLELLTKDQSSLLEISEANESHISQALEGFFRFSTPFQTENSLPLPKSYNPVGANRISQAMAEDPQPIVSEPVKKEPAAQPIIKNGHNRVNISGNPTSMNEVYNVPDNAPEYVKTGIKKGVDGKPNRYQCRYRCTKCEKTGKHFIPEGVETVDCHHCQTSLPVKKATPGTQGIQPDKFKNWFVAGNQLPVSEFVYSHSHALK